LNNQQILQKAINASKWSTITSLTTRAISPITFIVLARLLSPTDYGMVAIAGIVIAFCQIFWDAGLNKALIQSQEKAEDVANIVFYTNIGLSLIVFLIVFLLAPVIATIFKAPQASLVIRVQSLVIIINSLCAVQNSILKKDLKFKPLFYVGLIGTVIPGITSIIAAIIGFGYWALVAGTLSGAVVQLLSLWICCAWRPTRKYNWKIAKTIISFGLWTTGESLLVWAFRWFDSTIVAIYLGTTELGLYRNGNVFVQSIFGIITSPIMPVLYSTLALKPFDNKYISSSYNFATRWLSVICLASGSFLFVFQNPISDIVFGKKWSGVSIVIGFVALEQGITSMLGANPEVYRAIGQPKLSLFSMLISIPILILGCSISAKYGLFVFLVVRLIISVILTFVINPIFLYHAIKYNFYNLIRNVYWVVFSVIISSLVSFLILKYPFKSENIFIVPAISAIFGITFFFLFIYLKRDYRKDLQYILKRNNIHS
jgi:O-antigen/teichoic acid export membrane protein